MRMGETITESATRARTRRAILDAAVRVLGQNAGASMADIAAAAGVGRTTLHRYFPERSDLLAAISDDALDKITVATERARMADGPALAALERVCQEYFEFGDMFMLVFQEPHLMTGPQWEDESEEDREFYRLIERGQADGTFDPRLSPSWVHLVLWSLLFAGWQHVQAGAPRHEALSLCLLTLHKTVDVPPA
jgi:AcrR family transcriptional regulator